MNRKFYPYAPLPKPAPVPPVVEDDAAEEASAFAKHRQRQRGPMAVEPIEQSTGFIDRAVKTIRGERT